MLVWNEFWQERFMLNQMPIKGVCGQILDKIFLYGENNPAYITSPLVHNHTCAKAFI